MKTAPKKLTVAEFKAQFSTVVDELKQGREVQVTYGRNRRPLATMVPSSKHAKPDHSIRLGDLQKKGWTYSLHDFEMTDEEFLDS